MYETTGTLFHKLLHPNSGMTILKYTQSSPNCAQSIQECLKRAGLSPSDWIEAANISRSYGYQILRGERIPGRDILLRTALALKLSLGETQRLLAISSCGALYPRIRRDAAVIFALNQGLSLLETEELLSSLPERSLYSGET